MFVIHLSDPHPTAEESTFSLKINKKNGSSTALGNVIKTRDSLLLLIIKNVQLKGKHTIIYSSFAYQLTEDKPRFSFAAIESRATGKSEVEKKSKAKKKMKLLREATVFCFFCSVCHHRPIQKRINLFLLIIPT